jgi:phage terminase large subunit GpA-like protein
MMRPYHTKLKHASDYCLGVVWQAAQPRRALSVSEWADQHRELSSKGSGEPGRWRTWRTPFLGEIMDCFSATSNVHDIVIMKSSQVGVTESIINVLGYVMDHSPGPVMVMLPTLENRDKWKVQKLNPLLQDTQRIKQLLGGLRARDAANRLDVIDFPGGVLFLAGGNSPNSYAQISVRIIILDDFERFKEVIGNEGDVESLADGRTKAFRRAIRGKFSTPALKGGLIDRSYQESDQRRYHVPCPHCGELQFLEWGGPDKGYGIKWNHTLTEAWYLCKHCACEIYEHQKPEMLRCGVWIAGNPKSKIRGYHISALYAPLGLGPTWLEMVDTWHRAQNDTSKLQTFINTMLGEPWEQKTKGVDSTVLLLRLEEYPETLLVYARTIGVDVQKDRLELTVYDWGLGEECWGIEHVVIEGDTAGDAPWEELDSVLKNFAPDAVGIDTGYNTDQARAFCEKRKWCFPMKGIEGHGKPLTEDEHARKMRLRHRRNKKFAPHLIGDYAAMALVVHRLSIEQAGTGYVHFPKNGTFDDEFFAQLTSNKLEEKKVRGKLVHQWVQTHPRNEAYDIWKYALAALRLSGIDLKDRATKQQVRGAATGQQKSAIAKRPQQPKSGSIGNSDWSSRL